MSKFARETLRRLRQRADDQQLDAETRQLLLDAAAALIRSAPKLRAVAEEFSDSAWLPDDITAEALTAAALAYSQESGSSSFCLAVPLTSPRLGVALAPYDKLLPVVVGEVG